MLKFFKILYITFLIGFLFLSITFNSQAQAEDYNTLLSLKLLGPLWGNLTGGEQKTAQLEINNQTGYDNLKGEASLIIEYQGPCSNNTKENFAGDLETITPRFKLENTPWLSPDSNWDKGTITFSNFTIPLGKTPAYLEINTHPALCPGQYSVQFILQGSTETKTYTAAVSIVGGYIPTTTTTTTSPGRVAGAETQRPPFPFSLFHKKPLKQTPKATTTSTTTTLAQNLLPKYNPPAPLFHLNPFLAAFLSLFSINPLFTLLIAGGSFIGAGWLKFKERRRKIN